LHIKFDLAGPLVQPHFDNDPATFIGTVLCGIREQFVQS
jgi:hypothetical protein